MRLTRPLLLGLPVAVLALSAARPALAADCDAKNATCIDSDALWPIAGASTFFSIGSVATVAPRHFGFGLATSLQHNPIVFRTSAEGPAGSVSIPAIGNQLNTSFLFSYGVTERLEVDVVTPVTFYQDGTGASRLAGATGVDVPTSAVRDLRLGAAYALLPISRIGTFKGVGAAVRFDLSIPSGDKDNFAGDRGFVAVPSFLVEEHIGPLVFGAQLGARLRKESTLLGRTVGSQLSMSLGVSGALDHKQTLALTGEVFSLHALSSEGNSPFQWLAGLRWAPLWGGDVSIHGGGGGGFRTSGRAELLEPTWRATLDIRYAPLAHDRDGDGIPDRDDKCPDQPEDRDGFQDSDGCPDPDNDHDGIADTSDACPNEPETVNGFQDDDGCPDEAPKKAEAPPLPTMKCADGTESKPGEKCDSDKDGITDDLDQCPLQAEDKDGIADDDGCPEKDADEDGVGDQDDKCPLEPETINGIEDSDGCPEEGAHSLVVFAAGAIEVEKPVRFGAGASAVTKPMKAQIAFIAQRLQGLVDRGVEKIVIEAWADTAGENKANEALAQKRADAIAEALVTTGIPKELIKAKPGDLADPPAKDKANYLVTVRTKRKEPLTKLPPPAPKP
jgi:OOP family OmpA-OmpF porin